MAIRCGVGSGATVRILKGHSHQSIADAAERKGRNGDGVHFASRPASLSHWLPSAVETLAAYAGCSQSVKLSIPMITTDTIEGGIDGRLSYHCDVFADVLYLRLLEHMETPSI